MTKILDTQTQKYHEISDLAFVNSLIKLKSEGTKWQVFDKIIDWYMKKYENKIDSYTGMSFNEYVSSNLRRRKELNNKYGSSKDKSRRLLLSIPQRIVYLFKKLYPDLFQGDQKKFIYEFAKRYPQFSVPEKV